MTNHNEIACSGVGRGYWLCDIPGGCEDCRNLAAEANDSSQLDEWDAEDRAEGVPMC